MVTRRPLSLTLVHSPLTTNDYAVFPGSQYGSIYDFSTVKTILDDLNGAVPEAECIDESPIELVIYSSSVPDLCLIDLPGFIQIPSRAQPSQLRDRIRRLCQKYIEPASNIILAVSAADVDLANSEALKASRIVDPHGTRTIGVLTKLDLVDQNLGHSLLSKGINEYPLPLGYIGLALGSKEWDKNHPENFGVSCLRKRLAESLGAAMSSSVHRVYEEVSHELSALDLQFKVQYNDQGVSADVYMSFLMESLRNHIRQLETNLSRSTVSEKLARLMEIRLLETITPGFKTSVVPESDCKFSIPVVDLRIWQESLSKLTKSHIGTMATEAIRRDILDHMRTLGEMEHFRHHPQLVASIIDSTESFLDAQLPLLTLHLENAVKPFKKGTLFSPSEWNASRQTVVGLLHHCVESLDKKLASISKEVGSKRLKQAMVALEDVNSTADLSPYMSQKAFEASGLLKHIFLMKERISLLESSTLCSTPQTVANMKNASGHSGWTYWALEGFYALAFWRWNSAYQTTRIDGAHRSSGQALSSVGIAYEKDSSAPLLISQDPCMYMCYEVYFHLLMNRLVSTTTLYLHDELSNSFLVSLPDSLSRSLFRGNLDQALVFARENPFLDAQLKMQERKMMLEAVKGRLNAFLTFK